MIKQLVISSILLASAASYSFAGEEQPLLETNTGSMIIFGCPKCEPEKTEEDIALEPGSQFLEVRKIGDDLKIYRTENWLGGSPVSYVHMPSNPDDKRFAGLAEGPLDMSPLPEVFDLAPVASISDEDMIDMNVIGPKKPDQSHVMAKDVATLDAANVDPVMASVEDKAPMGEENLTELDVESFELRLN